jgi:hypothetical protein
VETHPVSGGSGTIQWWIRIHSLVNKNPFFEGSGLFSLADPELD